MKASQEIVESAAYQTAYRRYAAALAGTQVPDGINAAILDDIPLDDREYALLGMRDAAAVALGQRITGQLSELSPEASAMLCLLLALHAGRLSTKAVLYDALLKGYGGDVLSVFADELRLAQGTIK